MSSFSRVAFIAILLFSRLCAVQAQTCAAFPENLLESLHSSTGNVEVRKKFYAVEGASAGEIRRVMSLSGPTGNDGKRYDAYTFWNIEWRWPVKRGRPVFEEVKTSCRIEITLPCWKPPAEASAELRSSWQVFLKLIVAHEGNHLKIAEKGCAKPAQAIREALHTRRLTEKEANQIAEEQLERIRAEDRAYDRRTKHGREEGVRFP